MLHEIHSPLVPMRLGPSPERGLRHVDGLGAAIDMMRQLPWHGRQPIGTMVPLLFNALREGRAYFALTDDDKPWGLAVWHWASNPTHTTWLAAPPTLHQFAEQDTCAQPEAGDAQHQLWFSLLVTPFCASLPLLRQLQERLPQAKRAWAITPYGVSDGHMDVAAPPPVRPVW
ncbi:MAG: hypothetical protein U1A81_01120 [Hydrogenophaga sp.]|nr:hypothetical protein [Hydrogenophaga sp.]